MNIKNSLFTSALIALIAPCYGMDVEPKKPEKTYLPTIPMPSGEEFVSKMPPEILEHILTFVIENDPDAIGNLARIQEVSKGLAGFLSKDEIKWLLGLTEHELFFELVKAVISLNPKKTQLLVNLGALSNDKYKNAGIILYATLYAAGQKWPYQKLLDIISILEKAGATWKEGDLITDKITLDFAIEYQTAPIVKLLLTHGIKPAERHLKKALEKQNVEIAELLLKYGAVPTRDLVEWIISSKANPQLLKLLVTYGADVISPNAQGESLFELTENPEIAKILLSAGAMPNTDVVCLAVDRNNIELLRLFIAHGVDVNAIGGYHFPLPPLAYAQTAQVAKILLQAGAQLSIDCQGTTPLKELVKNAIADKNPLILVEVLKQRYPYQTALAIATAIMAGAPYISAVCTIL